MHCPCPFPLCDWLELKCLPLADNPPPRWLLWRLACCPGGPGVDWRTPRPQTIWVYSVLSPYFSLCESLVRRRSFGPKIFGFCLADGTLRTWVWRMIVLWGGPRKSFARKRRAMLRPRPQNSVQACFFVQRATLHHDKLGRFLVPQKNRFPSDSVTAETKLTLRFSYLAARYSVKGPRSRHSITDGKGRGVKPTILQTYTNISRC